MSSIIMVGLHGEFFYLNPRHQSSAFQHFAVINSGLEFKTLLYFSARLSAWGDLFFHIFMTISSFFDQ